MYGDQHRMASSSSIAFVARFARALKELNTASKPQISSLTMIAGDEPHLSPQIVDMLSDELLR
ncbi:hypothetical protein BVRB_037880, partial [Beta vulgaris subsp. vulgaris]